MEHYRDLFAPGDRGGAAGVTAALDGGDVDEAEKRIRTLLGDLAPGAGEEAHQESESGEEEEHEEDGTDHEAGEGADE